MAREMRATRAQTWGFLRWSILVPTPAKPTIPNDPLLFLVARSACIHLPPIQTPNAALCSPRPCMVPVATPGASPLRWRRLPSHTSGQCEGWVRYLCFARTHCPTVEMAQAYSLSQAPHLMQRHPRTWTPTSAAMHRSDLPYAIAKRALGYRALRRMRVGGVSALAPGGARRDQTAAERNTTIALHRGRGLWAKEVLEEKKARATRRPHTDS